MLGDIIISEPKAYIAFAWKRVIKQTLGHKVIKYFQVTENLFGHGLFDIIIPCNLLKGVLSELFQLYSLRKKMTVSFFLISKNDQIDFWKC
jgi:acetyl-CoA carboxylase carboxyl transferase subunit beta